MTPPRISAIIPVFGKAGDLPDLLDRLTRQTLKPHEIIVVESSANPLENPPPGIIFIKNPKNIGLGHDLNLGAKSSTGDYLLMIQQDCLPSSSNTLLELLKPWLLRRNALG